MRGIRMSEGMDSGLLLYPALSHSGPEGTLQPAFIHGLVSLFLQGGEQPDWMAMGHPVQSQELQAALWQRHIAILASFACMHVNELTFAIDITNLQVDPFQQAQP